MLKTVQFWVLNALGALALVLVLVNIGLARSNRELQGEVNGRAQFIQQTVQLQALYQDIIKAIADLSLRNKDDALKELLTREGLTISMNAPDSAAPAARGKP